MVTMSSLVSARRLEQVRQHYQSHAKEPPSYTALILKAVAAVIRQHPELNRAIIGPPFFRRIVKFDRCDLNVAVEKSLPNIPGHAYAPTIRNVDKKTLAEITTELKYYAQCTEENDRHFALYMRILRYVPWPFAAAILNLPSWIPSLWARHRGGGCWVNAPSKSGADLVFTIWPWPVTFSFGVVKTRPFAVGDDVVAEPTIPLLMVFDRRLMGGGHAGRIFADFRRLIEEADF
ncbi:MAG: 2-oxo acid dehydrogenase subunit E2 [Bdellovibrionaceae bacterium]|nr:2-oxo acid dehydrogenase subunit E2 [Pseudobdellovibrionaceae bacterium]